MVELQVLNDLVTFSEFMAGAFIGGVFGAVVGRNF